jgi:cytochrome P450
MTQPTVLHQWPFTDMSAPDPAPALADIAGRERVARTVSPTGVPVWLVTRPEDARAVLTDARLSRAQYVADPSLGIFEVPQVSGGLAATDGETHARLRRLVAGAFTKRRIEGLRPYVAARVSDLLDGFVAAGPGADLVPLVAEPLPIMVVCELTGTPYADRDRFVPGTETLLNVDAYPPAELVQRRTAMTTYLAQLLAVKRQQPADDLFSALVAAADGEAGLEPADLIGLAVFLLGAGLETTAQQIALCTLTLLHHPGQWRLLCERPELISNAVEELLRFAPTVPAALPRATVDDITVGDVTIPAGEVVVPVLATANRDPAKGCPHALDVQRADVSHITFGHGIHHCLGAPVARLILNEWLTAVTRRLPGLRLAVRADRLAWRAGHAARGPVALPLAW